jgi:hypothetical protein
VRFETGVAAGRERDIPSCRVAAPWNAASSPKRAVTRREPQPSIVLLSRPARVGDSVALEDAGDWIWTVDAIDDELGEARISTRIFEQPHTRTVALEMLRVRVERARRTPVRDDRSPARTSELCESAESAAERLRPITPRRELDELMDDVLFTPGCAREYDRRLGGGVSGPAIERLREEVRRDGYIVRDEPGGNEYARVRVRGRFDIVLPRMPTADAPVTVKGLYYPARRAPRRRRRPGTGRRQAA